MSRIKSRPTSAAIGSMVIFVSCPGITGLSAKSTALTEGFSYARFLLYTLRAARAHPALPAIALDDRPNRHALCSLADRLSPHRRRPHGVVQLALRARSRRQDAAAHR